METSLILSKPEPARAPELLTASTIAAIINVSVQGVHKRLKGIPATDVTLMGHKVWSVEVLPADYQARIDLAKKIKGFDRAGDIVDWQKRNEARFTWSLQDLTDFEQGRWPKRRAALAEYYRVLYADDTKGRAEEAAAKKWAELTGEEVSTRTIRKWVKPVDLCGGPEHAPDVAFSQNGRRVPHGEALSAAFLEFWKLFQMDNQRKFKPAFRKLRDRWLAWRAGDESMAIPGYATCPPPAPGSNLPYRWTYAHLMEKKHQLTPFQIDSVRQGRSKAMEKLALVRCTRAGIKVGQYYIFDDQAYDSEANVLAVNRKSTRALGLDAIDYTSANPIGQAFKPTLWNDEKRAREMLKKRDMVWFVASILTGTGYRTDSVGTTLLVEHGTAAIGEEFAQRIKDVTRGQVTVARGGIGGEPAHAAMFEGAAKGNPRFKAAMESARNRLRNDMADTTVLPGQVGMDRDHTPEELYGRQRYNVKLLLAMDADPVLREFLRFPFPEWREFVAAAARCNDLIADDPEHELEGWEEAGFIAKEWRLMEDSPWLPQSAFLSLSPDRQLLAADIIAKDPNLVRVRKLSRREAWLSGYKDFAKVRDEDVPRLVGPEFGVMRKIADDFLITFSDPEIDPYKEFCFLARIHDRDGHQFNLIAGEKYQTFLNPFQPDRLYVCKANGGYLGVCPALDRARKDDNQAVHKLLKLERDLAKEQERDLDHIGRERIAQLAKDKLHNAGVLAPGKTARGKQMKAAEKSVLEEIYGES